METYTPLTGFLQNATGSEVPMTFQEIGRVIGSRLPPSAYKHRPWWANTAKGHVHAKAWLNAGFETAEVDMVGRKLVFRRIAAASPEPAGGMAEEGRAFQPAPRSGPHPMLGALKGVLRIEPGCDLTKPALPEWEKLFDEKWAGKLG